MPHCSKCGNVVDAGAAFCHNCGASQGTAVGSVPSAPMPSTQTGLSENVAGLLCYVVGWITGLIFLLIDKRPFVRFHAAQSLVTFGALNIISIILTMAFLGGGMFGGSFAWSAFGFWAAIRGIVDLVAFIAWIVGMIKAYQHERFRFPLVADIADQIAGKSL
ncbi:MAG: DUF4870 domain-containing protein [Candidatus Acidiferrales bacterium]